MGPCDNRTASLPCIPRKQTCHKWKGEGLLCNIHVFHCSPPSGVPCLVSSWKGFKTQTLLTSCFSITYKYSTWSHPQCFPLLPYSTVFFPNGNISILALTPFFFLGPDGLVPTTHLSGSLWRLMHFGNIKKKRKQCKLRLTNPCGVRVAFHPRAVQCVVLWDCQNGGVKSGRK